MPLKEAKLTNYFKASTAGLQKPQKKRARTEEFCEEQRATIRSPLNSPRRSPNVHRENRGALDLPKTEENTLADSPTTLSIQHAPTTSSVHAEPAQLSPILIQGGTIAPDELLFSDPVKTGPISRMLVPASSQAFAPSSQRIVKRGEVMIRNSDDESDSDDSLEDIDELLAQRPLQEKPSLPEQRFHELSNKKEPKGTKRTPRRSGRHEKPSSPLDRSLPELSYRAQSKPGTPCNPRRSSRIEHYTSPLHSRTFLPVVPRVYKFSLESLAKQRKQHEASEERVAQATSMLQSYDHQRAFASEKSRSLEVKETFAEDLIDTLTKTHGDEDDVGRLKTAMQRTEALQHGKSWSFFEDHSDLPVSEQAVFPTVENEQLKPVLSRPVSRQQAFLSGYVGEHATKRRLPEEILLWLMDSICLETRDDLRYSYTDTLKHATSQLPLLITPERIDTLFQNLGASTTALKIEEPVTPRAILLHSIVHSSRPGLLSVLDMLGSAASNLEAKSRIYVFCILCRLTLDHSVVKDCHARNAIAQLSSRLMESISEDNFHHELQTVMTTVFRSVSDASLRLQLLQSIPPFSPRLALFRQRLALAFFFQEPSYLDRLPQNLVNLRSIASHLHAPQYTVNSATDYAQLAANVGILSIGIDNGNPPPSTFTKEDEIKFNSEVDVLAAKVKAMFTQIIDTSASHMKRTEAKEILEGFHARLIYTVRTRLPKKTVFGDSSAVAVEGAMEAFVVRSKKDDEHQ